MSLSSIIDINSDTPEFTQASALLSSLNLPVSDLGANNIQLWAILDNGAIAGVVGAEVFEDCVLLRSLAVAPPHRGQGLAGRLCAHVFNMARSKNRNAVYLLTETAERYFGNLGFIKTSRLTAPQSIKDTEQFSGLCPDSAAFMKLSLKAR